MSHPLLTRKKEVSFPGPYIDPEVFRTHPIRNFFTNKKNLLPLRPSHPVDSSIDLYAL
jgi:hypothetical protein